MKKPPNFKRMDAMAIRVAEAVADEDHFEAIAVCAAIIALLTDRLPRKRRKQAVNFLNAVVDGMNDEAMTNDHSRN